MSDIVPFDKGYEELIKHDLGKMGWFKKPDLTPYSFKEYPDK